MLEWGKDITRNGWLKKGCVVGMILMFFGTSVGSAFSRNVSIDSDFLNRGNTLYVGGSGPGNYTKIQDAVDNASNEDTVYVYAGLYIESIIINHSINLIGEDKYSTIINGNNTLFCNTIAIKNDNVTVSNFTIQNGTLYGIEIITNKNKILNNIINRNTYGIDLEGSFETIKDNLISNNKIINHLQGGMLINEWVVNTIVSDNVFQDNPFGIIINSDNNIISYNIFQNMDDTAIALRNFCKNNTISHNLIQQNSKGISLEDSYENKIEKNTIIDNSQSIIISGFDSNFNTVSYNNIYQNKKEPRFYGCRINVWAGNYWNYPRNIPKLIFGTRGIQIFFEIYGCHDFFYFELCFPWFQFDWHPAQEPYDIGG